MVPEWGWGWGWGCQWNRVSSAGNTRPRCASGHNNWASTLRKDGRSPEERRGRGWCRELPGSQEALISSSMKVGVLKEKSPP